MMEGLEKILRMKPIVLPRYLFNYYLRLGITAEELIILIFVIDEGDKVIYDPSSIGESLGMDKYKVMELLNNLSEKKIISIIVEKNSDGKSAEYISLDLLYSKIMSLVIDKKKMKRRIWIIVIFILYLKVSLVGLYLLWNVRLLMVG